MKDAFINLVGAADLDDQVLLQKLRVSKADWRRVNQLANKLKDGNEVRQVASQSLQLPGVTRSLKLDPKKIDDCEKTLKSMGKGLDGKNGAVAFFASHLQTTRYKK